MNEKMDNFNSKKSQALGDNEEMSDYNSKTQNSGDNEMTNDNNSKKTQTPEDNEEMSDFKKPSVDVLKKSLSEMQYNVTQKSDTEPPFENEYWNEHRKGIYVDITTGQPLFVSSEKFDSGCGWPSFSHPIDNSLITEKVDSSRGRMRTEVRSNLGDAHLGHVFTDGPIEKGGLRYCINSASLKFIPVQEMEEKGYSKYVPMVK